jgi:hypothetical protein
MPLKIQSLDNEQVKFQFENVVTIWNILKFLVEVPYLKHFIIEDYEGGNTLVPKETWKEEGVMFKEISSSIYLFPYDSVGFILDDSICNLKLYLTENYSKNFNYKKNSELVYTVTDTDQASLTLPKSKAAAFISLYLFSIMKLGFDKNWLDSLEEIFLNMNLSNFSDIEYLKTSLIYSVKKATFIIRLLSKNDGDIYYRITHTPKKCKKDLLKEEEIKNLGFLKKKILKKNKYYPLIYYSGIALICVVILILNRKLFIAAAILLIIAKIAYDIYKKNAYKIGNKKN